MSKIEDMALALAQPIAEKYQCYVVDVQYQKEGSDWYLRVFIDKEGGVGIEDCEEVNRAVSDALDQDDFIGRAYLLEVSSPGLFRELKKEREFLYYIGREITIKLYAPNEKGQKEFRAILKGFKDGVVTFEADGETINMPQKQIATVKLYAEF